MALVRCTCVSSWSPAPTSQVPGVPALAVQVLDPGCGYVLHRAFADAPSGPGGTAPR